MIQPAKQPGYTQEAGPAGVVLTGNENDRRFTPLELSINFHQCVKGTE